MTVTDDVKAKGVEPLVRTPRQQAALEKKAAKEAAEQERLAESAAAARLAQIVNLHIAGHSLADIGASIGATADEVDRMLASDAQRYVRSQPALRVYVRNYISEKYSGLLEAVWDEATDKTHKEKLEHQDRALRILKEMAKLHGAEAPTQTEVTVDAAPETVEAMVAALSKQSGVGYDTSIFDVVDAEILDGYAEEIHHEAQHELEQSATAVGESQEGEDGERGGF